MRPPVSRNQQLPNISPAPVSLGIRGFKKIQVAGCSRELSVARYQLPVQSLLVQKFGGGVTTVQT
jgi:hypothetical protein